ncbi:MAG: protein-L-isoaspartate O-methyltransferase [Acidisphaera sp.]|nr:protein-L-isoaspartate O-methyltransferase [Acidisphaera sp.]
MDLSPSPPAPDFVEARNRMVDGQIRPNRVYDRRILAAMRDLPRERFVPPELAARAYTDEDVPLGDGRVLTEPLVIARLLQSAAPVPGERGLVIGAGTGYGAALLAACGVDVTALEEDPRLLAIARAALAACAPGVRLVEGRLAAGRAEGAPWDLIIIEGAVPAVPPEIAAQLRPQSGRLATVLLSAGRTGQAIVAELTPAGLTSRPLFDCATPALPQLAANLGFTF